MSKQLIHRDLYVRITAHDGKSHVRCHRVWDADLFLASLKNQGSSAKEPEDRFTVSPATAEDYLNERKAA